MAALPGRLALAAAMLALAALAAARAVRRKFPLPGQTPMEDIPAGPWLHQAQDIRVQGNKVCARLRRGDMTWASDCTYWAVGQQFENDDGAFKVHLVNDPVGGTWIETARNIRREGNLLFAELRKEDLSYQPIAAVVAEAEYFANRDGVLYFYQQACASLLPGCLHGYTRRPNQFELYCSSLLCDPVVDRDACCEPAMPCSNITNCVFPQMPDPDGYCYGTVCDEAVDSEHCCVGTALCDSAQCPYGYTQQPLASSTFCASTRCDMSTERDLCCRQAAQCSTLASNTSDACPNGYYFNAEEYCDGQTCEDSRDRMICCQEADSCLSYNCTHGFVFRENITDLYCDGPLCEEPRDAGACCEPAMPCGNVSCGHSYVTLPDTYCLSTRCDAAAGDFEQCCVRAQQCPGLNVTHCPNGKYFNAEDFCLGAECEEARDRSVCCQDALECSGNIDCPVGYWRKNEEVYCYGTSCVLDRDQDRCCDVAAPCGNLTCPLGHVIKLDHVGRFCEGKEPDCVLPRDRDVCCDVAQNCSAGYSCPYGSWPIEGAADWDGVNTYCDGMACDESRDFGACCVAAAPCTDITCPLNYVQKPFIYCDGTTCVYDRDVFTCCERGMALQWYKLSIYESRGGVGEPRVQLAELHLMFRGYAVDYTGAVATSPGGNYPAAENPQKFIDGSLDSKWLDEDEDLRAPIVYAPIIIQLAQSEPIDHYSWTTPNDESSRDPIRWKFEGSPDGATWVLLHEVADAAVGAALVPTARFAQTPQFAARTPCFALEGVANAASPSCAEGNPLSYGSTCTVACASGFSPSVATLACGDGGFSPDTFTCD